MNQNLIWLKDYDFFEIKKSKKWVFEMILGGWRSKRIYLRPTRVWTSESKKKWKNTWNDKVVFYPTLNPHFSPCLECRTRSLDLEKVLYTVKWLLYHDIWPFIKIFESDLSITWLSLIKISSFRCTTEVCV